MKSAIEEDPAETWNLAGVSMAVNHFDIASYWAPREESPEELGGRTLRCLDAVSALSPIFRGWKFIDLFRDPDEMTEENIDEFLYPPWKCAPG
jgi:hypothetical protein